MNETNRRVGCVAVVGVLAWTNHGVWASEAEANTKRTERTAELDKVIVEAQRHRSTTALGDINSTGSRLQIETIDLPASVSVVSQEVIQLQGARNAIEAISSAVGMTGGISVGSIPSFATRGFAGNDITIMRDGIRQNTGSQSSRPLDSFLFERIEVLKGPASLLYGEGAIGGAINYVSKLPSEMFIGEAYASAGSWQASRYGAGAGGPTGIDGLSFRLDAARSSGEGYVDRSDYEYTAVGGALRYAMSAAASLTLSSTYLKDATQSYYGTPVVYDAVIDQNGTQAVRRANTATDRLVNARIVPGTEALNYNILDNFARAENSFSRLILETPLGGRWSVRNELYLATQRLGWRNTESTVWNPVTQRVERSSFFLIYRNDEQLGNRLDVVWDGKLGRGINRFLIGVLYDHNDQVRNSGQVYPTIPMPTDVPLFGFDPGIGPNAGAQPTLRIGVETAAAYVENLYEPIPALTVLAGMRFDRIDLERRSYVGAPTFTKRYQPFTGRLGIVYALADDWNVYVSYSTAAQPVSQLVSLTAAQSDFSLQTGRQYEVGTKAALNNKTELTLALFDIKKNNVLTSVVVPGIGRVPSQIGAQVSQGAELAVAVVPARHWRIDAHVAWTWKAEYRDFNENLGTGVISRDGNTPPNVAKRVAGAFVAFDIGQVTLTTGVRHVGERQANNNNGIQVDAYTTVDASVGYRWPRVTMTLRGRNLSDAQYAEWATVGGLVQRLAEPRSAELEARVKF